MSLGAVIFLCDLTGNAARPWAEAGYDCYCVDIQHSIRKDRVEAVGAGRLHFVWGDVRSWVPPRGVRPCFGVSFTPCTDVAGSGARDWPKKRGFPEGQVGAFLNREDTMHAFYYIFGLSNGFVFGALLARASYRRRPTAPS
jgi:hypothetical protein